MATERSVERGEFLSKCRSGFVGGVLGRGWSRVFEWLNAVDWCGSAVLGT